MFLLEQVENILLAREMESVNFPSSDLKGSENLHKLCHLSRPS